MITSIYLDIPEKKNKIKSKPRKLLPARCDTSNTNDDILPSNSLEPLPVIEAKVPSFVLHPSGTHYIPICLDASVITHAFPTPSKSLDVLQCHPVSIPVNFHPCANMNNTYALDVQNINVFGSFHQKSVRLS